MDTGRWHEPQKLFSQPKVTVMKFAENGEALVGGTTDGLLCVPLIFYHTLSYTKRRPLPDGTSA